MLGLIYRIEQLGDGHIPGTITNIVPTASFGGREDELIEYHKLRSARVVMYEQEAKKLGLKLDHSDEYAAFHGKSFALIIHGVNPKGSEASKANGRHKNGYSRDKKISLTVVKV